MPFRRQFLRTCTAAGIVGLAGCTTGSKTDTASPTDGTTTGTIETGKTTGTTAETPAATEQVAWRQPVAGTVSHPPVLTDDTLYVGTEGGTVTALVADDGRPRWEAETGDPVQGQPVVTDGTVLVVSGQTALSEHQRIVALDAATGTEQWSFAPDEWWLDILGTVDSTVFVATTDDALSSEGQTLYALTLADGSQRWSIEIGDNKGGQVTDDTVYVPAPGVVDAIGLDGTRRWRYEAGEYQFGTLSVAGDTVAFVTGGPREPTVHGLDPANDDERWTVSDYGAYTTRADGDRLFVGGDQVARLDPSTGEAQWVADQQAALYDAPVVDGRLYVASDTAAAIAVDDGSLMWTTELDAYLTQPVGIVGDSLLVHKSASRDDRNRHVIALAVDGGDRQWEYAGESELTEPVTGPERAYVGADDELLALTV